MGEENAPKRRRQRVAVAPSGDVLLIVGQGDDAIEVQVFGNVLSLASDVFARELSSSFIEAQSKTIELPDEHPGAVLDFCNLLHHKIENLEHCKGKRLLNLALFADARLCTPVLSPWIQARVAEGLRFPDLPCVEDFELLDLEWQDLLVITAIFDFHDLFWTISKYYTAMTSNNHLLGDSNSALFKQPLAAAEDSLVCDQIHNERARLLDTIQNEILASVGTEFTDINPINVTKESHAYVFNKFGTIMYCLAWVGVKPGLNSQYPHSLSKMIVDVRAMIASKPRVFRAGRPSIFARNCSLCDNYLFTLCGYCLREIEGEILEIFDRYLRELKGACLQCLREKGTDIFHASSDHTLHGDA